MKQVLEVYMDGRSRKAVIIISIVLLLAGVVGIVLPQFVSMVVAWFIGGLLLLAGGIAFYITWLGFRERWIVWLKPFVLITVGLLILLHPLAGAAALGLILAVYFLLDGFASVGSALGVTAAGWLEMVNVQRCIVVIARGGVYCRLADNLGLANRFANRYQPFL